MVMGGARALPPGGVNPTLPQRLPSEPLKDLPASVSPGLCSRPLCIANALPLTGLPNSFSPSQASATILASLVPLPPSSTCQPHSREHTGESIWGCKVLIGSGLELSCGPHPSPERTGGWGLSMQDCLPAPAQEPPNPMPSPFPPMPSRSLASSSLYFLFSLFSSCDSLPSPVPVRSFTDQASLFLRPQVNFPGQSLCQSTGRPRSRGA